MGRRTLGVGCLLLALLAAPAGAAGARPQIEFVTHAATGFEPLGKYRGYWEEPRGTLHVVDAREPGEQTILLPEGCVNRGVSLPDVLLVCAADPTERLWSTRSGEAVAVDKSSCGRRTDQIELRGLGRNWIGGGHHTGTFDHEYGQVVDGVYINRTSGECVVVPGSGFWYADLNSPVFRRAYRPPPRRCSRRTRYLFTQTKTDRLYVRRCRGRRAGPRVFICRDCGSRSHNGRLLAWQRGDRVRIFVLRDGRRMSWTAPPGASIDSWIGDRLFFSVFHGEGDRDLYSLDLSGAA